jgi:hypothetical protein
MKNLLFAAAMAAAVAGTTIAPAMAAGPKASSDDGWTGYSQRVAPPPAYADIPEQPKASSDDGWAGYSQRVAPPAAYGSTVLHPKASSDNGWPGYSQPSE